MVWPLVTARGAGLVQLSWMGEPVSQYGDVLVESSSDAAALLRAAWAYIITSLKPDLVRLPHVRDDAAVAPLIAELGAFATQRRTAPYISRAEADNAAPPSRNHRRALAKRLARLGTVTFGEFAESAQARAARRRHHRMEARATEAARDHLADVCRSTPCSLLRRRGRR